MSENFETTVKVLFEGDPASLVESYQEAADAAQSTVDRIKEQAAQASESLDQTGVSVQDLGVKFDEAGVAAEDMGAKLDAATTQTSGVADEMSASMDRASVAVEGLDEKIASVGKVADETGAQVEESSGIMTSALARVGAMLEGLEGKFGVVGEAAGKMGASISAAAEESDVKLGETGGAADGLKATLAGLGKGTVIGLAVAAAGALDLADKMDQATNSIAAQAGISTDAAAKIGAAFDTTAGQLTVSGTQMAAAYAPVSAQLGALQGHALSAAQSLTFMKDAAYESEATGTSLSTTTSALAATMQAYGIKVSGATSATDALYVAGKVTGTGFSGVGASLDKMKAKLGDLAPPLGQSAALLMDLTEHGETGRLAMSALSTAVQGLEKPTLALSQAQADQSDALAALPQSVRGLATEYLQGTITSKQYMLATQGLSTTNAVLASQFASATTAVMKAKLAITTSGIAVEDSKGKFLGLGSIIGELHKQIAGMSETQALATLTGDGLGNSAAKMLPTIEAGSAAFNAASGAVSKQNSAQQAAAKATANLHDQMKKVEMAIEDLFTTIGEKLMPIVEKMISAFVSASKFVIDHKEILIALAVVVGGVLTAAIYSFVASLFAAEGALAPLIGPLGIVAAAVAVLAVVAYEVYKHWDEIWPEIKKITIDAWDAVKRAFDDVWHFIERWGPLVAEAILVPLTGGMSLILPMVIKHWAEVSAFFSKIPAEVEAFFSDAIHWLVDAGKHVMTGLWDGIKDLFEGYVRLYFHTIPQLILGWLGDAGKWLLGLGGDIIRGLVNGVQGAIGMVKNAISGVAHTVKSVFHTLFGWASPTKMTIDLGRDLMLGLAQGVAANANVAHTAMTTAAKGMSPALTAGLGTFNVPVVAGAQGALAGGSRGGGTLEVNISVNGAKFATAILPDMLTELQQHKRVVRTLDL